METSDGSLKLTYIQPQHMRAAQISLVRQCSLGKSLTLSDTGARVVYKFDYSRVVCWSQCAVCIAHLHADSNRNAEYAKQTTVLSPRWAHVTLYAPIYARDSLAL